MTVMLVSSSESVLMRQGMIGRVLSGVVALPFEVYAAMFGVLAEKRGSLWY